MSRSHGSIRTLRDTKQELDSPFQSSPKTNSLEHGIDHVGDYAIVRILRRRMMSAMVLQCLQKAKFLKGNHQFAPFAFRQVIPFVYLVGIDANGNEQ